MSDPKRTVPLVEALEMVVDSVMESHRLSKDKHPDLKALLLEIAAATGTLMCAHFERIANLPMGSKPASPAVPDVAQPVPQPATFIPWKKPTNGVH